MPRSHNCDRNTIGRFNITSDEHDAGGIRNVAKRRWVFFVRFGDDGHAVFLAVAERGIQVELLPSGDKAPAQLLTDTWHRAKVTRGGAHDRGGRAKVIQEL